MEQLTEVCNLLRHESRHELASLLNGAHMDFDACDIGLAPIGDGLVYLCNAVIYAPASAVNKLRDLSQDDNKALLKALQEVWPFSKGGGTVIREVEYRIDIDSLTDEPLTLFDASTGWERVDRAMDKLRQQLTTASTEEDFQQVGHLCREILISLAQAVFDPERHSPIGDGKEIIRPNAKCMIDRYLTAECSGPSNAEVRKCVRDAYDLANKVQHDRDATHRLTVRWTPSSGQR